MIVNIGYNAILSLLFCNYYILSESVVFGLWNNKNDNTNIQINEATNTNNDDDDDDDDDGIASFHFNEALKTYHFPNFNAHQFSGNSLNFQGDVCPMFTLSTSQLMATYPIW